MVREAQEVRARVLADLVRRRRALYGQVEQLRGGRQNLVEGAAGGNGGSFDHILETLQRDFDPVAWRNRRLMTVSPRQSRPSRRCASPLGETPSDAGGPGRGAPERVAASAERRGPVHRPRPPQSSAASRRRRGTSRRARRQRTHRPNSSRRSPARRHPDRPARTAVTGEAPSTSTGGEAPAADPVSLRDRPDTRRAGH